MDARAVREGGSSTRARRPPARARASDARAMLGELGDASADAPHLESRYPLGERGRASANFCMLEATAHHFIL